MYYMGIDGSATYSRLVGAKADGTIIGRHTGNFLDITKVDLETVSENLKRLLKEFSKLSNVKLSDCKGVCIGLPKNTTAEMQKKTAFLFENNGVTCPIKIVSDLDIVLATEFLGKAGIVVTSNIDSYGYGVDEHEKQHFCGGFGHVLDSGGSGYFMGMQAIKYALMSYDGRLPKSTLEEKICAHFSIKKIRHITEVINSESFSKSKVSELALVVKYTAENGDTHAKLIEEMAAKELYMIARALYLKCSVKEKKIAIYGSVFLLNDAVRECFISLIKKEFPEITIALIKEKPEMGALYIAGAQKIGV